MVRKTKKYNRIKSHLVLKTKKLTPREKRYCSCLMKVRSKEKTRNPYGICTAAVYNKQGLVRDRVIKCSKYYDLSRYPLRILRPYAKEKKIKNYNKLSRKELLSELKKYQQKK
tara:strand:- start:672 stop:1010 length:339 start_codon:yes stop_codon:yes gene_type:complete